MSDPQDHRSSDPSRAGGRLTHLDEKGRATMVDVGEKPVTRRVARARAVLRLDPGVRDKVMAGDLAKGEALGVARVAGIQAAKDTGRLIPLCHPVPLDAVGVEFSPRGDDEIVVTTSATCTARTGVEMEALTAASVAALTLYDMAKALCREARIDEVLLVHKSGGRSGDWTRAGFDGSGRGSDVADGGAR